MGNQPKPLERSAHVSEANSTRREPPTYTGGFFVHKIFNQGFIYYLHGTKINLGEGLEYQKDPLAEVFEEVRELI